jgi:DNA polymerase (family 10)
VDNAGIANAFEELADLLELAGDNAFKTRAYRTFAATARELAEPLAAIVDRGELAAVPGGGKAIAKKVPELLATGTFPALEKARAAVPATLREVLGLPGLGVKSVRTLWQAAGVTTLGELVYACEENRLAHLPGFGPKKQSKTLAAAKAVLEEGRGSLLAMALEAARVIDALVREAGARDTAIAGEARRGVELVTDLVVLVRGLSPKSIEAALDAAPGLGGPHAQLVGDVVRLVAHGVKVRAVAVDDGDWIRALLVGTGDADHVRWLEERAAGKGGLGAVCDGAATEAAVYRALGLTPVPPELREGAAPVVPAHLVTVASVRGVFHVHTDWSDGTSSILDMARAAEAVGLQYIGISDHSRAASYANGLDAARLREQMAAVAIARREIQGCTILHGIEVDILPDGSLDLDDETLGELDFVVASVHGRFGMPPAEMTARIVRAVSHPLVTILGHPTGRLLLGRRGYTFDVAAVARAAAANDTYLEINANAQRMDLSDVLVRRAAREGAKFAIDPDAHAPLGLRDVPLGVAVARRAGITQSQLLNARDRDAMGALLEARKAAALARLARPA